MPSGSVRALGFDGAPRAAPGLKPSLAIIWNPLEVLGRAVERASSRAAAAAAAASSALDLGRDLASAWCRWSITLAVIQKAHNLLREVREGAVLRVVCVFGAECRFPFHLTSWAL